MCEIDAVLPLNRGGGGEEQSAVDSVDVDMILGLCAKEFEGEIDG